MDRDDFQQMVPRSRPPPPAISEPHSPIEILHEVDLRFNTPDRGQKTLTIGMQAEAAIGKRVQRKCLIDRSGDPS
jgi:hypothetical protein